MTGDSDDQTWPADAFTKGMQNASEEFLRQQRAFAKLLTSGAPDDSDDLQAFAERSAETATFKSRVQSGGRISIPDTEREILGIQEGDIVQAVVIPLERSQSDSNGK